MLLWSIWDAGCRQGRYGAWRALPAPSSGWRSRRRDGDVAWELVGRGRAPSQPGLSSKTFPLALCNCWHSDRVINTAAPWLPMAHMRGESITFSSGLCLNAFSQRIWAAFQKQPSFLQAESTTKCPEVLLRLHSPALQPENVFCSWRNRGRRRCSVHAGGAEQELVKDRAVGGGPGDGRGAAVGTAWGHEPLWV